MKQRRVERLFDLFGQALVETDPQKFAVIVLDINCILEAIGNGLEQRDGDLPRRSTPSS
jgi:hypothetical protein